MLEGCWSEGFQVFGHLSVGFWVGEYPHLCEGPSGRRSTLRKACALAAHVTVAGRCGRAWEVRACAVSRRRAA